MKIFTSDNRKTLSLRWNKTAYLKAFDNYVSHEPLWSDDNKFSPIAALGGFLESQNKEEVLKLNVQKIWDLELSLKNIYIYINNTITVTRKKNFSERV